MYPSPLVMDTFTFDPENDVGGPGGDAAILRGASLVQNASRKGIATFRNENRIHRINRNSGEARQKNPMDPLLLILQGFAKGARLGREPRTSCV
jgi:hypothetical protein